MNGDKTINYLSTIFFSRHHQERPPEDPSRPATVWLFQIQDTVLQICSLPPFLLSTKPEYSVSLKSASEQ